MLNYFFSIDLAKLKECRKFCHILRYIIKIFLKVHF